MNVALWAEIRRLAEIEGLSGSAISRRLRCSRHTVAAALKLDRPPVRQAARRASILDPYKAKVNALLAKSPELSAERIREEIARGPEGYTGSVISVRRYLRTVRPCAGVSIRRFTMSRPRRCRSIGANAEACKLVPRPARSLYLWPCSATAG